MVAGVCDGFIGNRMLAQYTKQAAFLLEEGCSPQQVDQTIEAYGFAMGPFRMSDLAGNDISWAVRKARKLGVSQMRSILNSAIVFVSWGALVKDTNRLV